MKQIFLAIKEVLLSYSPARSLIESIMKFDFKIGDSKTNLMQLCFSNLASWPLVIILLAVNLDPFRFSWSLVKLLSFESPLILFLLDGHLANMLLVSLLFFVLEWVLRKEYILIAIVFYFLNRSELHIHLATVAVLAVYLSRITYLWWLSVDSESETKKIWITVSVLQFVAWLCIAFTVISTLDYIQINNLLSESGDLNRFNFLAAGILLYNGLSLLFLSLWGHFHVQKEIEPTHLPTYYSTSNWILRFNMSYYLQSRLRQQVTLQLEKHLKNEIQFQELKSLSPSLAKFSVEDVLKNEIGYLKEAKLRISKI